MSEDNKREPNLVPDWFLRLHSIDEKSAEQDRLQSEDPMEEKVPYQRLSWNQYFIQLAEHVAQRATCLRRRVGALAVFDRRILATGYNGAPSGMESCMEKLECLRERLGVPSGQRHELCSGIHAEQNVIIQAAIHGVGLRGSTIYCTHQPCFICLKMLINCKIDHLYFKNPYPDSMAEDILRSGAISYTILH